MSVKIGGHANALNQSNHKEFILANFVNMCSKPARKLASEHRCISPAKCSTVATLSCVLRQTQ